MMRVITETARKAGATLLSRGDNWDIVAYQGQLHYRDGAGKLELPMPRLPGMHQIGNLGVALAMLRHQDKVTIGESALKAAPLWAQWPARMQRLEGGPLNQILPNRTLMLDGGHNPDAGQALAVTLKESALAADGIDLVTGMLANKDVLGFLDPLRPLLRSIRSLPVPGHEHHGPEVFAALAARWDLPHSEFQTVTEALEDIAKTAPESERTVLVAGTLYLAGAVLIANDQPPV
jgi:dihydrofolate synthase / folylpolyglutamate synthase